MLKEVYKNPVMSRSIQRINKNEKMEREEEEEEEEDNTSEVEDNDLDRWTSIQKIQKELFDSICGESRTKLKHTLNSYNASLILQVLVTFTYPNLDQYFQHDSDILMDAAELLGPSVTNLNALQAACMIGEEDLACDLLDYVAQQSERMHTKKVLYEFLSKVWGAGNTSLHLASFMGMSNLVKRLIDLGANTNKRNERKYKAVDCADDDKTRALFLNIKEVVRYPIRRSMSVDGSSSLTRREVKRYEPIFTKHFEASPPVQLQRSKAILQKKSSDKLAMYATIAHSPSRDSRGADLMNQASKAHDHDESHQSSMHPLLMRAKSLGSSATNSSDSNSSDEENITSSQQTKPIKSCLKNVARRVKRVIFDPRTLALDCARSGDYFQLKLTLENPSNQRYLKAQGIDNVFDTCSIYSQLSLMHLAASYNQLSTLQYLVEHGASVNPKDREGWTPLHCAAAEGHESVVRYLVSLPDIQLGILNNDDESPGDVCSHEGIRCLLKERLVRRLSNPPSVLSGFSLEDSLTSIPRSKLAVHGSASGGDSGLLRPVRSGSHHRIHAPSKPFSPPHSFSKPFGEPLTEGPISPVRLNTLEPSKLKGDVGSKGYHYASLTSF